MKGKDFDIESFIKSHKAEMRNVRINYATIGIEDHGILTIWIGCEWEGGGQGFGGYALDTYDEEEGKRVGHRICADWILALLDTFGVGSFHHLEGLNARIIHTWGKVCAIGHITKDRWFVPEILNKEIFGEENDQ